MTPFRIGHKIEYMHQNIKIYYAHGISLIHDEVRTLEMCPAASKPAFQWYEYALDVVGFQRLEMDEASFDATAAETSYVACMIISDEEVHAKLTPQLLEEDLNKLVDEKWCWRVR
jgi:hypothetical protein